MRAHELQRYLRKHRALVAGALTATGVLAALPALAPASGPSVLVVAAAHDLQPGHPLTAGDLTTVALPQDLVPAGTLTTVAAALGHTAAGAVRRGEPLTDVRLVAPGLLEGYPGMVAAPVRVADPAAVRLLSVGDRIDLVAVSPDGGGATVVAESVPVVAVPGTAPGGTADDGLVGGALVVVAVPEDGALALAEASVQAVISVVLRH